MSAGSWSPLPRHCLLNTVCHAVVTVRSGSEKHCILMDAGVTRACLLHNARLLQANLNAIGEIVLSHGHFDHFGGLTHLLKRLNRKIPVTVHPEAFLDRRMNIPMIDRPTGIPRLDEAALTRAGAVLRKSRLPALLASDLMLTNGEIGRAPPFEKGFPWAEAHIDGAWTSIPSTMTRGS